MDDIEKAIGVQILPSLEKIISVMGSANTEGKELATTGQLIGGVLRVLASLVEILTLTLKEGGTELGTFGASLVATFIRGPIAGFEIIKNGISSLVTNYKNGIFTIGDLWTGMNDTIEISTKEAVDSVLKKYQELWRGAENFKNVFTDTASSLSDAYQTLFSLKDQLSGLSTADLLDFDKVSGLKKNIADEETLISKINIHKASIDDLKGAEKELQTELNKLPGEDKDIPALKEKIALIKEEIKERDRTSVTPLADIVPKGYGKEQAAQFNAYKENMNGYYNFATARLKQYEAEEILAGKNAVIAHQEFLNSKAELDKIYAERYARGIKEITFDNEKEIKALVDLIVKAANEKIAAETTYISNSDVYSKRDLENKKKAIADRYKLEHDMAAGDEDKIKAAQAKKTKDDQRADQEWQKTQKDNVSALANAAGQMSIIFKKQSSEYKAFATAQALISTYLAADQVLAEPDLWFPVKIAEAIAITAAGLANVAKINSAHYGGTFMNGPKNIVFCWWWCFYSYCWLPK